METKKNIYQKLQEMRIDLQNTQLKKSGHNKFSKFYYYELKDFLPTINEMMAKQKLFNFISFGLRYAKLTILNIENPEEKIIFTSPMSTAKLTACHEVQNLGAVQTYLRRYLYIVAFEIIENDALDAGEDLPDNGEKPTNNINPPKEPMESSGESSTVSKEPPPPWDVCPQCLGNLLVNKPEFGGGWYCENNKKGCKYKLNPDKVVKSNGYKDGLQRFNEKMSQ